MCRAFVATDNTSEKHSQPSVKYAKREKRTRENSHRAFSFLFSPFFGFLSLEERERKRNTISLLMNAALELPVSWQ